MIKSERLILRPLKEDDIEMIRRWRSENRDSFFDSSEISKEQQRAWYTKYKESQGTDYMFIICLKSGVPIGQCALYDIEISSRRAKFGRFLILEEFRHKGYAEEAVTAVIDYAFENMRLHKIKVEVFIENVGAIAIYARAGFTTTTKPIMLMERVNSKYDPKEPFVLQRLEI